VSWPFEKSTALPLIVAVETVAFGLIRNVNVDAGADEMFFKFSVALIATFRSASLVGI